MQLPPPKVLCSGRAQSRASRCPGVPHSTPLRSPPPFPGTPSWVPSLSPLPLLVRRYQDLSFSVYILCVSGHPCHRASGPCDSAKLGCPSFSDQNSQLSTRSIWMSQQGLKLNMHKSSSCTPRFGDLLGGRRLLRIEGKATSLTPQYD